MTSRLLDHLKWRLVREKAGNYATTQRRRLIWANWKTETFMYRWPRAHASFDVTCFPAFVGASNVISSVLSIRYFFATVIIFSLVLKSRVAHPVYLSNLLFYVKKHQWKYVKFARQPVREKRNKCTNGTSLFLLEGTNYNAEINPSHRLRYFIDFSTTALLNLNAVTLTFLDSFCVWGLPVLWIVVSFQYTVIKRQWNLTSV